MADNTELTGMRVKITADLADYLNKLDDMSRQTVTASDKVSTAFKGITNVLMSAGVGISGFAATAVKSAMDWGVSIDKLSHQTGMASEQTSTFLVLAKRVGIDTDTAGMMFARLASHINTASAEMERANSEGKTSNTVFDQLGISTIDLTNGAMRPMGDIFTDIKDKLSGMQDGWQKTAIEQELFGKSGYQLNGLLNMTQAEMQGVIEKAQAMGLILNNDQSAAWTKFSRDLASAKGTMTTIGISIGNEMLPKLQQLLSQVQGATQAYVNLNAEQKNTVNTLINFVAYAGSATLAVRALGLAAGMAVSPWVTLAAAIIGAGVALNNYLNKKHMVDSYNKNAEVQKSDVTGEYLVKYYDDNLGSYNWRPMTDDEKQAQASYEQTGKNPEAPPEYNPPSTSPDAFIGGGPGSGGGNNKTELQAYLEEMQKLISIWQKEVELGQLSKEDFQSLLQERLTGLEAISVGSDEVLSKQQEELNLMLQIRQVGEQSRQKAVEDAQQQQQLGNITNEQLAETIAKQYELAETDQERIKILLQLKNVYNDLKKAADEYYDAVMKSQEDEAQNGNKELDEAKKKGSSSANFNLRILNAQYGSRDFKDQLDNINTMISDDEKTLADKFWGGLNITPEQEAEILERLKVLTQARDELIKNQTIAEISAARQSHEAWANNLADVITNTRSAHDILKQQWRDFVKQIIAEQMKINIGSNIFSSLLGGVFGVKVDGKREFGGDVEAGKAYIVGEKRPEIFVPSVSGSIIPNANITSGAAMQTNSSQTTITNISVPVTQNFQGQQDASVVAHIKASIPYIKNEIRNAINNESSMRNAVKGAAT